LVFARGVFSTAFPEGRWASGVDNAFGVLGPVPGALSVDLLTSFFPTCSGVLALFGSSLSGE
jgi:hypothetical protein